MNGQSFHDSESQDSNAQLKEPEEKFEQFAFIKR